ncbi:protein trichome birefringence-like 26 isoform X2 [Nicotiana sylvestris]|uniref:Protein trichome birefringence-like 26 isoform X2 n=1 Tax=Nicotiana sylvestris TaxID=4096 RepID=A0A1U7X580_NICSY|nr:PREDICTED: protein trichome birefringence-like 26 isoform X2 [Nicotiana sylvestris]
MKAAISNNVNYKKQFSVVFIKFAVCFLLMGFAYRLFLSSFVQFSTVEVSDTAFVSNKTSSDLTMDRSTSQNGKCDLFKGDWVQDPTGPFYTNHTCYSIEAHQNCMRNGRPDTGYLYWRWKPKDCEIPKFNPKKFVHMMRGKSLAFVGDSIMRNHVQSLLCILSQLIILGLALEMAYLLILALTALKSNVTLSYTNIVTEYSWRNKVMRSTMTSNTKAEDAQLHLDKLDDVWTRQFDNFDYVVIAGGKWYLKSAIYYENNKIVGCHNCPGKNITEVGFEYAYRKALNSTLKYITRSKHKAYTFFRTATPDHFENGEWNTGGYCNRTDPFKEGEIDIRDIDEVMRKIELEEFERALRIGSEVGLRIRLFDTTFLSLLRPDGHPGVYRQFQPFAGDSRHSKIQNDCLHWCLPGPIDSWNDLMMEILVSS